MQLGPGHVVKGTLVPEACHPAFHALERTVAVIWQTRGLELQLPQHATAQGQILPKVQALSDHHAALDTPVLSMP